MGGGGHREVLLIEPLAQLAAATLEERRVISLVKLN
jgi:hypothetical protein